MDSCDRLLDEIAHDLMQACAYDDSQCDTGYIKSRLQLLQTLSDPHKSLDTENKTYIENLANKAEIDNQISSSSTARLKLDHVRNMQRVTLQKQEHEMMAKLLNMNGDKSTLLKAMSSISDSLLHYDQECKQMNDEEKVRRLAANILWHLTSGLNSSFSTDPADEDLPDVDPDQYELP